MLDTVAYIYVIQHLEGQGREIPSSRAAGESQYDTVQGREEGERKGEEVKEQI